MFKIFKRITVRDILVRQLEEARVGALEAEAAAERYDSLATMYRGRIERICHQLCIDPKNLNGGTPVKN